VKGSAFGAVSLWFFVCVWNVSGTAERVCAKFTCKTCLVPRSDKFEGHGRTSRLPGMKKQHFWHFRWPVCSLCLVKHL